MQLFPTLCRAFFLCASERSPLNEPFDMRTSELGVVLAELCPLNVVRICLYVVNILHVILSLLDGVERRQMSQKKRTKVIYMHRSKCNNIGLRSQKKIHFFEYCKA